MDPVLQPVQDKLDSQSQAIAGLQIQVSQLQQEVETMQALINSATSVVIANIQTVQPDQTLWYEARSANAPKTGPHGTISITPGNVCVADFHPVALAGGFSDNAYCLFRLYNRLTPLQKAILESATKLSVGYTIDSISPVANFEAVELDFQIRKSSGVVINVGLQLLPDGTLRVFDYVKKDWVAVSKVIFGTSPISLKLNATCDNKNVTFTSITVNGVDQPISAGHPVTMDVALSPYFNTAYQLDGRPDAKAYKLTFEKLTSTFAI